ncbi:MAG TPA: type II secretion system F family protein, partial [Candidatus Deferrimicrobiaceae bacterium]|nr:type II secretion system F family protein [Candidatus Deferrimicrobiaceae bacterium]
MPLYRYTAITRAGVEQKGSLDADSVSAARKKLHADGVYPLTLAEGKQGGGLLSSFSLLGSQDFLPLLTRQLSTLVGAGVPVVSALQSLGGQIDDPEVRRVITALQESVREGMPCGRAIESHPKMFPELYASMVRAGEEGGMLPLSL